MLIQERMIQRVRELCQQDDRLISAMMYGSFAYGNGDRFSDIEFLFFFEDGSLVQLDQAVWLAQIAPVSLLFANEFGVQTAIFSNLIRGEFHFHRASDTDVVDALVGEVWFPSLTSSLIVDKNGELTPRLQNLIGTPNERTDLAELQGVINNGINWFLFGSNVLGRGEYARAHELLSFVHRNLLKLIRVAEKQTEQWHIPSRSLEQQVPPESYERYRACTASLEPEQLRQAYWSSWDFFREVTKGLELQHGSLIPAKLCFDLEEQILHLTSQETTDARRHPEETD